MISTEFVRDVPRISVADLTPGLQHAATPAAVDVRVCVDGIDFLQRIEVLSTPMPRRRGARRWLVCPSCARRCAHLYPAHGLVCRSCAGLRYVSQFRRPT